MSVNSKIFRIVYHTDPKFSEYRYPFKIFTEKGLRVSLLDPGDREQAPMILGVDYEVTGVGEADGGLVRLTLAGLHKAEKGLKLVIKKGVAHQAHGGGHNGNGNANETEERRCECSVPLWNAERDYSPPSLVYGSDHYLYEAIKATGPGTEPGPQDPTAEKENSGKSLEWQTFELPASNIWGRITCSPQGRFAALSFQDKTAHTSDVGAWSDDGLNWTKFTLPTVQGWRGLACNKDGVFVAVCFDGSTLNVAPMARSVDGINWAKVSVDSAYGYWGITCTPDGMFVVVGPSMGKAQTQIAAWSNDGLNWTRTNMPRGGNWNHVVCNSKGQCVAAGTAGTVTGSHYDEIDIDVVAYSPNGKTWQGVALPVAGQWKVAVNKEDRFFIVDRLKNIGLYSDDGLNWHQVTLPGRLLMSECVSNDEAFILFGANFSDQVQRIFYSYDAVNWLEGPPLPRTLNNIYGALVGPQGELLIVPHTPVSATGLIIKDFKNHAAVEPAYWQRLDTNPAGTCLLRASRNIPMNYVPLNGAMLERAKYPRLWGMAEKSGLIVPEADWSADQSRYSSGDGSSTFRIPNKALRSDGWVECLKVK